MSWRTVRLRRLVSATGGSWGTEPEDGEITAPCIRGTDFDYAVLRSNVNRAPVRGFSVDEFRRRSASRGDLIVEKSGGGEQQPVGRIVLHEADEHVMPTNFAGRLRPLNGVDPRFICYLMASLYSDGRTAAAIKQTTGIQNLDLAVLLDNQVQIPSEAEQQAIANFLDAETTRIDSLVVKKRQLVTLLEIRFLATVDEVTSELEVVQLRRVAVVTYGLGEPPPLSDDEIPILRATNINRGRITTGGLISARREDLPLVRTPPLEIAEILVVRSGAYTGDSAIITAEWAGAVPGYDLRVRPKKIDGRFLAMQMLARRFLDQVDLAKGRAAQPHLNAEDLGDLAVMISSRTTERFIADTLTDLDRIRRAARVLLQDQIALLQERRQALITAAVTGELDIAGAA